MYYLRTRAAADAIKFTVDQQSLAVNNKQQAPAGTSQQPAALMSPSRQQQQSQSRAGSRLTSPLKQQPAVLVDDGMTMEEREAQLAKMICSLENKDACLMCGS
jgi:hypothetical protein